MKCLPQNSYDRPCRSIPAQTMKFRRPRPDSRRLIDVSEPALHGTAGSKINFAARMKSGQLIDYENEFMSRDHDGSSWPLRFQRRRPGTGRSGERVTIDHARGNDNAGDFSGWNSDGRARVQEIVRDQVGQ